MTEIPKPGEFYRHFKNRMYQVLAVAAHSETGEKMVVYQALYGDFGVYVRPLLMFMEPVDREKYPDVRQKDRFERVKPGDTGEAVPAELQKDGGAELSVDLKIPAELKIAAETEILAESEISQEAEAAAMPLNALFTEFLDADACEAKVDILRRMKGRVGQREVDSLYLCLDAKPDGNTIEEQLDNLIRNLNMQQRYDSSRLRRS